MPWVRLDDQFPDHPKVLEAGPLAAWLFVCGLAYCARHLTDGLVPAAQVARMVPGTGRLADRLVAAGLWEVHPDGGYLVHDYLVYNPSRAQVLAMRQVRAAAGQRGGQQKASNLLGLRQTVATDTDVAKVYPVPHVPPQPHAASPTEHVGEEETPVAVPTHADGKRRRGRVSPVYGLDFEAFWVAYPRHDDKQAAALAYARRLRSGRSTAALQAAAEAFRASTMDRPTDKIPYASTWLNGARDEEWQHGPPDADRRPTAGFRDDRSPAEKTRNPTRAWRQTYDPAKQEART